MSHPFTESLSAKAAGVGWIVLAVSIQWALLVVYGEAALLPTLADSLLSVLLLAVAGYLAWYVLKFVRVWQAQILLAILVQLVTWGGSFLLLILFQAGDVELFQKSLPFRFLTGLLSWTILLQWYWILQKTEQMETELVEAVMKQEPVFETIDRISVKDGARIHIVHLEELYCIQASGDYVVLCTEGGQYVKEQTMKYFETSLPPTFLRIHRSTIVNTEYIQRVELFGKDTYQVRLKNGQSFRASSSGYKLLKERLSL